MLSPASSPFTNHTYCGASPPLTGDAVKVTSVPSHTSFADASMETSTITLGVMFMVMVLEAAGLPEVHISDDVTTQTTSSPSSISLLANSGESSPTNCAFILH